MNNTSKILAAFAIGAAAGAIAGILLAPDKGSETRRKLGEEGKKLAEGFKRKCKEAGNQFDEIKKEMEEAGNGLA
ncbi:YtxH domain-containing protein [Pseudoflavitalea sp. X16]|uniref:YtxH domain-containing protein n=1 Tax=Paraflavitalea devenefica TaxID=2716334 RepID=UPI0014235323|nr:YtxH domain-containing protein [Paraflavitalea devenefica]NII27823.1 YtxH domain-containing protein [Paraflavitalea devenefica]